MPPPLSMKKKMLETITNLRTALQEREMTIVEITEQAEREARRAEEARQRLQDRVRELEVRLKDMIEDIRRERARAATALNAAEEGSTAAGFTARALLRVLDEKEALDTLRRKRIDE